MYHARRGRGGTNATGLVLELPLPVLRLRGRNIAEETEAVAISLGDQLRGVRLVDLLLEAVPLLLVLPVIDIVSPDRLELPAGRYSKPAAWIVGKGSCDLRVDAAVRDVDADL